MTTTTRPQVNRVDSIAGYLLLRLEDRRFAYSPSVSLRLCRRVARLIVMGRWTMRDVEAWVTNARTVARRDAKDCSVAYCFLVRVEHEAGQAGIPWGPLS